MYLKSLEIRNFRKFSDKTNNNNIVHFVAAEEHTPKSDNNPVAKSTTLIVGKNNSGKTTITKALKKMLSNANEIKGNDFNFPYLKKLLDLYKNTIKEKIKDFPILEFKLVISKNTQSKTLLNNIAPFMSIEKAKAKGGYIDIDINVKYEIKESQTFLDDSKKIINNYGDKDDKDLLFRKFRKLIDVATFQTKYFNQNGTLVNNFKLSDLIEIKEISANRDIQAKSLSQTFNKIIAHSYTPGEKIAEELDKKIIDFNSKMTKDMANDHKATANGAFEKIQSNTNLNVNLRADLDIDSLIKNIMKYEYKEDGVNIPEEQFGLGYSNLMTIISEIIDYANRNSTADNQSKIKLICIEEPETFMHPQMQEVFINNINDVVTYILKEIFKDKKINSQLIITTHSAHIVNSKIHNSNSLDSINYITSIDNYAYVVKLNDNNVKSIEKYVENDDETEEEFNKRKINDLKFLKKHIKYKISEIFFSDAIILVEGVTEETLISYYIDQDEDLKKQYISIFNIDGAHGHIYRPLIKALKIPALIITDLDIKRNEQEKESFNQINSLAGRTTTNSTIKKFNNNSDDISDLKDYFQKDNLYVVFQKDIIGDFFATSFEEAYILQNYKNNIMQTALKNTKPQIYQDILGDDANTEELKNKSYKLQEKLSKSKSDFANELLYQMIIEEDPTKLPDFPSYIQEGLVWLKNELKKTIIIQVEPQNGEDKK